MITSERYIVLLLFSLLVILVCSEHNIPTIAYGAELIGNGNPVDRLLGIRSAEHEVSDECRQPLPPGFGMATDEGSVRILQQRPLPRCPSHRHVLATR